MKTIVSISILVVLVTTAMVACGRGQPQPATPMPPTVITNGATDITATKVRLNGTLDNLGTAISVSTSFVWGTTLGGPYPNETALEVMDTRKAYSFDLTGLAPGTYYFQAKAVGDGVSYGVEKGFTVPVTFPDSNLEVAIREAINKPEGAIYLSDLESLTNLVASQKGISDISGLEYCSNLQQLDLQDNNISDISLLADLKNVNGLHLDGNKISDIMALSGLTNLHGLWLAGNDINDISPINGLIRLESLVVSDNNVSNISPLAALISLEWLDLVNNNITDISPLSGLTNLDWLPLGGNNISDISPLVKNSGLSEGDFVHLGGNPLTDESMNVYVPQLLERGVDVQR
jgi:Leucine-rich repeat (LRR) protein